MSFVLGSNLLISSLFSSRFPNQNPAAAQSGDSQQNFADEGEEDLYS